MANVLSLVSYNVFPAKLGGQKGIAFFNKYFSAYHRLVCVTVKSNEPRYANYEVLNILSEAKARYINIFYFFTLRRLIKEFQVSHLVLEHPYYGWLALLLKKFCGIKMITHSHNIEAQRFKSVGKWWWKMLYWYERYIYRNSDKVFCITRDDWKYITDSLKVHPLKCHVITYGIEWAYPPGKQERAEAGRYLQDKYDMAEGTVIYLFNGTLDYLPNLTALKIILTQINPALLTSSLLYKIIICGKNLPPQMNELRDYSRKNIIYAGFVEDISLYFKGAHVFINPVTDGGGIKTKLVEALGYNMAAVSTRNGAIGVDEKLCNGKLLLVPDNDWKEFVVKMTEAREINTTIGPAYFDHFFWEKIAKKAAQVIAETV